MRLSKLLPLMVMGILLLAGCGNGQTDDIKIGIMPDAGALPLLLMDGVEVVPFSSARERDTALLAGEIQGIMGDVVGLVTMNHRGFPMRTLTVTESRFLLVGSSKATADPGIGISENTVIEYMVDHWESDVPKVAIPQVPVRLEMLREGKISQACLTDAMVWSLLSAGFPILKDQADGEETPAILTFSEDVLNNSRSQTDFIRGWNTAVSKINGDPESYRSTLEQYARLPKNEDNPYPIPLYHEVKLPSEAQIVRVVEWYETKFDIQVDIEYDDIIIARP